MASSLLAMFSAFLIICMASVEAGRQFKVGDDLGWQQPPFNNTEFYTQWAENNRFQIGDSLGDTIYLFSIFPFSSS